MFRQKAAERWGKWRYLNSEGEILCSKDSCCAPNSKDCCEANGAVWAGLFGAFFVVLAGGYYIYKRTDCCTDDCCMEDIPEPPRMFPENAVAPAP